MALAGLGVTILAILASQVLTPEGGPGIEKSLLDLSEALPVEYRADIYFRLAEAGKGPRGRERTAALEALFLAAAQARQKLPLTKVASFGGSREAYVASASRLRLDQLSIRCRVVREIGKTDVQRARELFRQLYHEVAPPSGGCGPWLVFDPSLLESTLQGLLVGLQGDALAEELSSYARAMVSGVQIPGLVRLLLDNSPAANDAQGLALVSSIISARLGELQDGDRAFVYATARLKLIERVGELARRLQGAGMSAQGLLAALRSYLVRHLTQERCRDTLQSRHVELRTPAQLADAFRQVLRETGAPVEPLAEREMRPAKSVASEGIKDWSGAEVRSEMRAARDCVQALVKLSREDEARARRSEWAATLDRCFTLARALVPARAEEEADIFHQKAVFYYHVFDLAPGWWDPRVALDEWAALFENSRLKTESPMEWLSELNVFLDLGRELSQGNREEFERLQKKGVSIPGLPGPHRQAIWERAKGSRDPVVAMYGLLESVAPLKWGAWRLP